MTRPEAAPAGSGAMFDRIAHRYDLLNKLLSFGIDVRWRARAVAALALVDGAEVLDVASGTGDVALEILERWPGARVTGVDPSPHMLEIAGSKAARAGRAERLEWVEARGEALPFPDRCFDACCIAFGIRNVPERGRALAEMARVTRPGGRVVVLELSEPGEGLLGRLGRWHVHSVVPRVGALLSGAREYRYLQESIAGFPPPAVFAELMQESGLRVLEVQPLTFGVAHLYVSESVGADA